MVKRILVPIDGSAQSLKALTIASNIAKIYDAELALLVVTYFAEQTDAGYVNSSWLDSPLVGSVKGFVEDIFTKAKGCIPADVKIATYHLQGHTEETILKFVDENQVDIIAMGGKQLSFVDQLLRGSISRYVVEKAKCPVIIVK